MFFQTHRGAALCWQQWARSFDVCSSVILCVRLRRWDIRDSRGNKEVPTSLFPLETGAGTRHGECECVPLPPVAGMFAATLPIASEFPWPKLRFITSDKGAGVETSVRVVLINPRKSKTCFEKPTLREHLDIRLLLGQSDAESTAPG